MATETKSVASGTHLTSIGTVKAVVGLVKAVDQNGNERVLQAGDTVFANETIVTAGDGTVLIEFQDGTHLDLPHSAHIVLDADVYAPKENVEQKAEDEAARIEKAIAEGRDPSIVTDAAAAGGTGGDEGSSTPLVIDFNNTQGNVNSGFPTGPVSQTFASAAEILQPTVTEPIVSVTVLPPPPPPEGEPPIVIHGNVADVVEGTAVTEGGIGVKPITFTFLLTNADGTPFSLTHAPVTVTYHLENGTAVYGQDYSDGGTGTHTITIPSGVNTYNVTVNIIEDAVVETNEFFKIVLDSSTGASVATGGNAFTVNIINDDVAHFTLTGDTTVAEGSNATYHITLTGADLVAGQVVSLNVGTGLALDTATNGVDYNDATGVLTVTVGAGGLTAGSEVTSFTVHANTDNVYDPGESYTVQLTGSSIGTASGTVVTTITDTNTPVFTLTGDTTVAEGSNATYHITLTGADLVAGQVVSLNVGTGLALDTATNGVDYNDATGVLTVTVGAGGLTAGSEVTSFTVHANTDNVYDPGESYTVQLTGSSIGTASGTVVTTITDTNTPVFTLTGDTTVAEGSNATYHITLTGADLVAGQVVSLNVGTGLALDTATNGVDYNDATGVLTVTVGAGGLTAGSEVTSFTVHANTDSVYDPGETYSVQLTGSSIGTASGTVVTTITDTNTPVFTLTGDATVAEGADASYQITLTGANLLPGQSVTFTIATGLAVDTATEGVDYNSKDGTLTFTAPAGGWSAGSVVGTFTVHTIDDTLVEGNENYSVLLTNSSIGTASGTVVTTIVDNDIPPPNILTGTLITNSNVEGQVGILTVAQVDNPFHAYATFNVLSAQGQQGSLNKDVGFDILPGHTYNGALETLATTKTIVTDFTLDGAVINSSGGADNVQLQVDGKDSSSGNPTAITFAFTPDDRGTVSTNEATVVQAQTYSQDGSSASNSLTDTTPNTFNYVAGDAGNDTVNGSSGADILNGGAGADKVYGNGGNDILVYDSSDTVLDGGAGIDLLRLDGQPNGGGAIDLRGNNAIQHIEGLLITDDTASSATAGNTVVLNAQDVLNFTQGGDTPNVLHVLGNAGDVLDLKLAADPNHPQSGEWIAQNSGAADSSGFVHYTATISSVTVTLLVDSNIHVV